MSTGVIAKFKKENLKYQPDHLSAGQTHSSNHSVKS